MLRSLVPALGCGVMMAVCMAVMAIVGRRNRDQHPTQPPPPASPDVVAALRAEVARLRQLDEERRAPVEDRAP